MAEVKGKKVMIVEDSITVRFEVKIILRQIDVPLVEAANGSEMFNALETQGSDIAMIIMDLTLKNEDGFDLVKKLKADPRFRNTPILILTEHADKGSVLEAKNLGVNGYIRKPIDKNELINRVTRILEQK